MNPLVLRTAGTGADFGAFLAEEGAKARGSVPRGQPLETQGWQTAAAALKTASDAKTRPEAKEALARLSTGILRDLGHAGAGRTRLLAAAARNHVDDAAMVRVAMIGTGAQ